MTRVWVVTSSWYEDFETYGENILGVFTSKDMADKVCIDQVGDEVKEFNLDEIYQEGVHGQHNCFGEVK